MIEWATVNKLPHKITLLSAMSLTKLWITSNAVVVSEVPEADFSFDPQPTTLLDPTITFTNTSIGTRPLSYQWNFGVEPGTYIITENPGHTYESAGNYLVQLITTNGFGCSDTTYRTVVIGDDIAIYVPNTFTPNLIKFKSPVLRVTSNNDSWKELSDEGSMLSC